MSKKWKTQIWDLCYGSIHFKMILWINFSVKLQNDGSRNPATCKKRKGCSFHLKCVRLSWSLLFTIFCIIYVFPWNNNSNIQKRHWSNRLLQLESWINSIYLKKAMTASANFKETQYPWKYEITESNLLI